MIRFAVAAACSALATPAALAQGLSPAPREAGWATTITATPPKAPPKTVRAKPVVTGAIQKAAPSAASAPDGLPGPPRHELEGIASYYWQEQMTASGETFDKSAMTAAHRTLPFGTRVRVTNLANGQSVVVRINDRGPFKPERVIDVSDAAAEALGFRARGLTKVKVEVVE